MLLLSLCYLKLFNIYKTFGKTPYVVICKSIFQFLQIPPHILILIPVHWQVKKRTIFVSLKVTRQDKSIEKSKWISFNRVAERYELTVT